MNINATYRPSRSPLINLPLATRSVGHYVVNNNFSESGLVKDFVQLFWGIEGVGEFFIDGKTFRLHPRQICFFFPGDEHIINTITDVWNYRWFTLDGSCSVEIVEGFGFAKTPTAIGPCPEAMFIDLERDILDNTPKGQCTASSRAYLILAEACKMSRGKGDITPLTEKCVSIINNNFTNPVFGVNELADMLNVHRSRLSRIFRQDKNITVKDYITACRLQKGMSMIKETEQSITEIASKCGFNSADYFAKAIKKATGCTPLGFRKR